MVYKDAHDGATRHFFLSFFFLYEAIKINFFAKEEYSMPANTILFNYVSNISGVESRIR